jgi:hypothetical protein
LGVLRSPCVKWFCGLEGLQSVSHHNSEKHFQDFPNLKLSCSNERNLLEISTKNGVARIGELVKLAELVMVMVPGLF